MILVPLTKMKYAKIDESDAYLIVQHRWQFSNGYAWSTKWIKGDHLYDSFSMHRFLMKPPTGMIVDHINGDKIDNRRCNMRVVTQSINNINRHVPSRASSGRLGVYMYRNGRYKAQIKALGRQIHLGCFSTFEDACRARTDAEMKYFGQVSPTVDPITGLPLGIVAEMATDE